MSLAQVVSDFQTQFSLYSGKGAKAQRGRETCLKLNPLKEYFSYSFLSCLRRKFFSTLVKINVVLNERYHNRST